MSVIHFRSSFSDFCSSRHSRDSRFKAIEKMRERENLFSDYIDELRRKEKDEKHQRKEQVRKFINLRDVEAKLNFPPCCSNVLPKTAHRVKSNVALRHCILEAAQGSSDDFSSPASVEACNDSSEL